MPRKQTGAAGSIKWTGKNLADVRRFHKDVAHYPADEAEKKDPFYRDHTQHPDNLHLTTGDGTTLVVAPGDTIIRDEDGKLSVKQGATRPIATGPRTGKGRVIDVSAGPDPSRSLARENEALKKRIQELEGGQ